MEVVFQGSILDQPHFSIQFLPEKINQYSVSRYANSTSERTKLEDILESAYVEVVNWVEGMKVNVKNPKLYFQPEGLKRKKWIMPHWFIRTVALAAEPNVQFLRVMVDQGFMCCTKLSSQLSAVKSVFHIKKQG